MADSVSAKTVVTDKDVAGAAPGVYRVAHARRLYLKKTGADTGSYFVRYRMDGRRPAIGVGSIQDIKIARARHVAERLAEKLADDVDPLAERREKKAKARAAHEAKKLKASIPTVKAAVEAFVQAQPAAKWERSRALNDWLGPIVRYAYPTIGALKVSEVSVDHIVAIMKALDDQGLTATRNKTVANLAAVFNASLVRKHQPINLFERKAWKGDYTPRKGEEEHFRRIGDLDDAPAAFQKLLAASGSDVGAAAWCFMALTAARPSEALGARWDQIDLEKRIWLNPASKTRKAPLPVPLSNVAIEILKARMKDGRRFGDFVFGGVDNRPPTAARLAATPGRVGIEGDIGAPHSFRSVFRDVVEDKGGFRRETAEAALGHSLGAVEKAYRRETGVETRATMMEWYAGWLAGGSVGAFPADTAA
jgi:integrase